MDQNAAQIMLGLAPKYWCLDANGESRWILSSIRLTLAHLHEENMEKNEIEADDSNERKVGA